MNDTPDTTHGAAVALADLGWSVFPCHQPDPLEPSGCSCGRDECSSPAKHPRTARGVLDASRDFEAINGWWGRWPEANLAVATGAVSGIVALDVDGPEGADSLRCLQDEFGALPETVISITPNGEHRLFRYPAVKISNSASKLAPGLDVRGHNGYVIVPPSQHASGQLYRWAVGRSPYEHGVAPAPAWLLELLAPPEPQGRTDPPRDIPQISGTRRRYVAVAIEAELQAVATAPEGQRNYQLNRSAYSLARFADRGDIDVPTVARALAAAASRAGLGSHEIEKTLRSAFQARGAA